MVCWSSTTNVRGPYTSKYSSPSASIVRRPYPSVYSSKSDLEKILKKMKFQRYKCFSKAEETFPGLEPLKNNYEDLDVSHVRSRQPGVLYLRTELLLQRLGYLKPSGILPRQKRKLIERCPPVLILIEDGKDGAVNYLRGIIRVQKDGVEEKVHVLHSCSELLVMRKVELQRRVEVIRNELSMADQTTLKLLLEMPVFLLRNRETETEKFVVMHKFDLPKGYSLDQHTAKIYPPVYSDRLELNPRLFRKDSVEKLAKRLPTLRLADVLDYSYPNHYGEGEPEDLNTFLNSAEKAELKQKYNKVL